MTMMRTKLKDCASLSQVGVSLADKDRRPPDHKKIDDQPSLVSFICGVTRVQCSTLPVVHPNQICDSVAGNIQKVRHYVGIRIADLTITTPDFPFVISYSPPLIPED
jgi:hypothetical protein